MNTLYPGVVGTSFIFSFGTFTCLILACAQISHGANFPVNAVFMYFTVGLSKCSPVSSDLMELQHGNLLSWFNY